MTPLLVQLAVGRRAGAGRRAVGTPRRQLPRVLRLRVHDPVAVGELLDRPVGEVTDVGGMASHLRRLAQRIGRMAHAQARGIHQAGWVAVIPMVWRKSGG